MDLYKKRCKSCTKDTPTIGKEKAEEYLKQLKEWRIGSDGTRIRKELKFSTYLEGLDFAYSVGKIAEEQGHHPDMYIGYKKVRISLITYAAGGLTENDFILASKIDHMYSNLDNNKDIPQ